MTEDQYLIEQLKQKNLKTLDKVYLTYKEEFFLFARGFSISEEDIADVYQETVISFYENIQKGKLNQLTSSLKTYLFAIGKFKIYKQANKSEINYNDAVVFYANEEIKTFEIAVSNKRQKILKKAFNSLGDKCKIVLELYYYEGLTLDEIQNYLKYSSKDVLKSQKSRCLKQLKKICDKEI